MDKMERKRRDKKSLFADWTLDNCVYFREPIIISAKNYENAIFIINIRPPEVYAKKCQNFLFTEIQFNINDFLEKSGEDYNC